MKRFVLLLFFFGFVVIDVWWLKPQDSLLFKPPVRSRFSAYVPALNRWLNTKEQPTSVPVIQQPRVPGIQPSPPVDTFTPPVLPSLEDLTQNWTAIPAHSFPRPVLTLVPVTFHLPGGSSTMAAGSRVTALASAGSDLTLAPTATSPARATLSLHQTNLADILRSTYDQWLHHQRQSAHLRWQRQRQLSAESKAKAKAAATDLAADGSPNRAVDGSYPLLLASMAAGEVTEITPKKILSWEPAQLQTLAGQPTWCINLWFKALVPCSLVDAQAQAQVRQGRVIAWIYPGSGEPVP